MAAQNKLHRLPLLLREGSILKPFKVEKGVTVFALT